MRFTRRSNRIKTIGLVATSAALACAATNCSSEVLRPNVSEDSGAEPETGLIEAGPIDASRGDGSTDAAPFDPTPLPIECTSEPCATALTTSSSGDAQTFCALLSDKTVACWGANGEGQLGRGDDATAADSAIPQRVLGLANIVAIDRTCAVDAEGAAFCWGTGPYLKDDAGTATTERTPIKLPLSNVRSVSVTSLVGCAVDDEGVVCWGNNNDQQVTPGGWGLLGLQRVTLPPGSAPAQVAVGSATFVRLESGTTLSWGSNPPLGRVSSLAPDPFPQPLALTAAVNSLDVAIASACAAVSGTGYCWGESPAQSGVVDLRRALPMPVVTPERLRQMSTTSQRSVRLSNGTGMTTIPSRWCAVAESGSIYCWGYNASGQAGNGTKDHAFEPVKVVGLPAAAVGVKTSFDASCALLTTGKVYCWGSNFYGQLGTGQLKVSSLEPKEVLLP
jgi:Regulator of chromosome condensation (RCC1) repeat